MHSPKSGFDGPVQIQLLSWIAILLYRDVDKEGAPEPTFGDPKAFLVSDIRDMSAHHAIYAAIRGDLGDLEGVQFIIFARAS